MSFCNHCEGQRFDRARVLRVLRAARQDQRKSKRGTCAERALKLAIDLVRTLDIPHIEIEDEATSGEVVH